MRIRTNQRDELSRPPAHKGELPEMQSGAASRPASCQEDARYRAWERAPQDGLQNLALCCKLPIQVNLGLVCFSLDCLVQRHAILCTSFKEVAGVVTRRPAAEAFSDFEVVDARLWSTEKLEAEIQHETETPFDLLRGRLFRVRMYSVSEQEHYLLFCVHSIAADTGSLGILLTDFGQIYKAVESGEGHSASPLTEQRAEQECADRAFKKASYAAAFAFWEKQLSGETLELALPFDRRRNTDEWQGGLRKHEFSLSNSVLQKLEDLAGKHGVPLAAVYLTGYVVLLSRYGASAEIRVGVSGTTRSEESADVVGNFSNPVTVVANCQGDLEVGQLLNRIRDAAAKAQQHAHVPSALVTRHLQEWTKESAARLFQAFFHWEDLRPIENTSSSLPTQVCKLKVAVTGTEACDLALNIEMREGAMMPSLIYRKDLFEPATIERMARHWIRLMEDIAHRSDITIERLEMMPDEERSLVLGSHAGGVSEYPRTCLHDLFTEQAALRPNEEALVFGTQRFTYRQLDEKSNQIAQYLKKEGITHGDRVGIFMDRSADMIVSMLGVLKAGGAYVPIDPDYPAERLKFIAEDTDVRHVLTAHRVQAKLPSAAPMTYLDDSNSPIRLCGREPVSHEATAESIAVVIYTSGSTGVPKAACIPHRAAIRTVRNTNYVAVKPEDRIAQVASPSFDAAIMEVWLALANGATLIGMLRETLLGPSELRDLLESERISILVLNTAYLHQIGRDTPDVLRGVRKVLFGGEAAEPGPMRSLLKHVAPGVLVNGYGPAEGCVITTYYEIDSIPEDAATIPIGKPVANAQVYLLDLFGRPVPIGVPGEIYIGGAGVAKGYWNRPELTAQRFIPDIFSGVPGALLYRTGDLARMRGNGELEFRGRADEQVKIRGHRIELAEVRQAIEAYADVKQVFLMVREDQPGDKRLTAYVTLNRLLANPQETLRQHTKQKLPSHMLPAAFVFMEEIPLNTNGKVDRKALPAPLERPELASVYREARTDLERILTHIWQELLRVDHVGVNDNFFDLGGHSLLAARLIARIERETGHNLPVASLFDAPTISRLTEKLRNRDYEGAWSTLVELHAPEKNHPAKAPFFCVHSLGANLVSFHKIASLLRGDRAIYGLQPHGLDGRQEPLKSIEAMAAAYVEEIRRKQPHGPYYVGGICIGGVLAYEIAQQLQASGEQVALVALIDSFVPGKLQYQHARRSWIEYLDGHLGDMSRRSALASAAYFCKWAANGGVLLARALGWRDNSSLGRATRRVAEAHTRAALAYQPKPYVGKIIQFMCSDGPHRAYEDRRLAWSSLVPGDFEIRIVPGDHLSMVEEPNVRVLADEIQSVFDRISGFTGSRRKITDRLLGMDRKKANRSGASSNRATRVNELTAALPVAR